MTRTSNQIATPAQPASPTSQDMTDLGNARRLVERHGRDMRFCPDVGWLTWLGGRWAPDRTGAVERFAKDAVRSIEAEALRESDNRRRGDLLDHAERSQSARAIRAMIELARTEPEVVVATEDLDRDPMLLTVANGTLDLATGMLREHRREDLITMMAPVAYVPDAEAPLFEKVVRHVAGDGEVEGFLRRWFGYGITGRTDEQALLTVVGQGGEGKSVMLEAVASTLGDYAQQMPSRTLTAVRDDGIPNDLARLRGKRLVRASETEQGAPLAEAKVKQLTGGDTVTARFMRQEFFEFRPVCKIVVATNHLPEVRGGDRGIWRRIKVVRCPSPVPEGERDRGLASKLAAEREGILAWLVRGCLEWQQAGLAEPAAVTATADAYRTGMDVIGRFLDECCVTPGRDAFCQDVYHRYTAWCVDNGERAQPRKALDEELKLRGFETRRSTGGRFRWVGLDLRDTSASVSLESL